MPVTLAEGIMVTLIDAPPREQTKREKLAEELRLLRMKKKKPYTSPRRK